MRVLVTNGFRAFHVGGITTGRFVSAHVGSSRVVLLAQAIAALGFDVELLSYSPADAGTVLTGGVSVCSEAEAVPERFDALISVGGNFVQNGVAGQWHDAGKVVVDHGSLPGKAIHIARDAVDCWLVDTISPERMEWFCSTFGGDRVAYAPLGAPTWPADQQSPYAPGTQTCFFCGIAYRSFHALEILWLLSEVVPEVDVYAAFLYQDETGMLRGLTPGERKRMVHPRTVLVSDALGEFECLGAGPVQHGSYAPWLTHATMTLNVGAHQAGSSKIVESLFAGVPVITPDLASCPASWQVLAVGGGTTYTWFDPRSLTDAIKKELTTRRDRDRIAVESRALWGHDVTARIIANRLR